MQMNGGASFFFYSRPIQFSLWIERSFTLSIILFFSHNGFIERLLSYIEA